MLLLQDYKPSYSRRTLQEMVTPFTRSGTTKMMACSLALRGLAKNSDSSLYSLAKAMSIQRDYALILNFWRCQKKHLMDRDALILTVTDNTHAFLDLSLRWESFATFTSSLESYIRTFYF